MWLVVVVFSPKKHTRHFCSMCVVTTGNDNAESVSTYFLENISNHLDPPGLINDNLVDTASHRSTVRLITPSSKLIN